MEVVQALAALAQGVRLRVFRALVVAGPAGLTPGAMAATVGVPGATLSFHLKELMHAGLVSQERASRHLIYRAAYDRMGALIGYLGDHCCQGEPCLAGLAAADTACSATPHQAAERPANLPPDAAADTRILILCTHNSARSVLAEGMLNHLAAGAGLAVRAHSAGSAPSGRVHPMALRVLSEAGVDVSAVRSKSWDEFARADAPRMRVVITVCDQAAAETCPVWPGAPVRAHWGYPDPSRVQGSDEDRHRAFELTRQALAYRCLQLLQLPLAELDDADLRDALRRIAEH